MHPRFLLGRNRLVIDEQKDKIDEPQDEIGPGGYVRGLSDVFCEGSFFHIISTIGP